ncbi:MAG: hypothetical protein A3G18_12380 [Rhodospirillales bacterium RIFCSPLOWO2_12_FULL_58_28]|nr:MAG: hypothetical protein A3G18_12380 [Rhodospirillales bacterium RIFCSPLOWO2_12_FULL_58_28]
MKKVSVVTLSLMVAACGGSLDVGDLKNVSNGEALGAGLGAIVGGVAGYHLGNGVGQMLFTAAGVIVGGSSGYLVGRRLGPSDQARYNNTARNALATVSDGQAMSWSNPKTGSSGVFRPTSTFRPGNDYAVCRDYRAVVSVDKEMLRNDGTACQLSDGQWVAFENGTG